MKTRTQQQNVYRFIACPTCKHQFEWLGLRLPNYCPECGGMIMHQVLQNPKCVLLEDRDARVSFANGEK